MECRLIRMTTDDYQQYSDIYQKTEYSFFEKGRSLPPFARALMQLTAISYTFTQNKFNETINDPDQEMYFFETDGKINGFVYMIFKNKYYCDIVEFTVLDKGKGLGRLYFGKVLDIMKERNVLYVRLGCPDHLQGAQAFWKKMGFKPKILNNEKFFELKVKYKK